MKFSTVFLGILISSSLLFGAEKDKVSQIKIFVPNKETLTKIWNTGIDFEGSSGKIGGWMEFVAGPSERQQLNENGISYQITEEDLSTSALQGLVKQPVNVFGFGYGSMGGYYTFQEVLQQLDTMKLLFPSIITARESIGTSNEGRAIWLVKISAYPDVYRDTVPEVLYTALHHAREPEGMMSVLYYMWWLLQNYGTDPEATYLVNNRQMWFIPVVNPDGYVYNQTTNPGGGGMWRKNRRNNGGSYGVDLNRNYGPYDMWNAPNGGSSTTPSSDVYRGTWPFSEPEVSAISNFVGSKNIRTCLNYHTYGNYLVFPWGYTNTETDDSLTFREFAFDMTADNHFTSGTDLQTVNYSTRGNSDDFLYGGNYNKTFAMTPEVGTTGFWPSTGEILPLAIGNLNTNKYNAYFAGQYSVLKHYEIQDLDHDGLLTPGETFSLETTVRNKGLTNAPNLSVNISASTSKVEFTGSSTIVSSLVARSDSTINFLGMVRADCPSNIPVQFIITLSTNDGYIHRDTINTYIGNPTIFFADSATGGTSNWVCGGTWGTTTNAHTPPYAFTDSPSGNYTPLADYSLTLKNYINLYGYKYCVLKFWTKWAVEPTFDFATIEISTNSGVTWTSLRSNLSHSGSARGKQFSGSWGYEGYTPGLDWVEQEVDLSPFVDNQVSLRFRLLADGNEQRDGWYLDDIRIIGYYRFELPMMEITDNGSTSCLLTFGENPLATDGIDTLLGEQELPPKPSTGTFDARWNITGTDGSNLDLRAPISISHPSNTFTIDFQPGPGGYPFIFKWNPVRLPQGGWHLRDASTHGTLTNLNMWMDTMVTISNNAVSSLEIIHTIKDTLRLPIQSGWSIVSLPMITENRAKTFIYPTAVSDAFAYEGSYIPEDTLVYGKAYWLKYSDVDTITFTGVPIVNDTIQLPSGWSMVGGLGCPAPFNQMVCDPPPCRPFVYRDGYVGPISVKAGEGFWMKGPMNLIISSLTLSPSSPLKITSTDELNTLNTFIVTDHVGRKSTLYFGTDRNSNIALSAFDLPPIPPQGSFDVRFSSQRSVEVLSSKDATIMLQSLNYPIKLEWNIIDKNRYAINNKAGYIGNQELNQNGSIVITDPAVTSLVLRTINSSFVPLKFTLKDNYPNPFNPSTIIEFDISTPSIISLKVLNTLGQEVNSLIQNQHFISGHYQQKFDGSMLSSGIYFYRLSAIPLDGTPSKRFIKKMILLK